MLPGLHPYLNCCCNGRRRLEQQALARRSVGGEMDIARSQMASISSMAASQRGLMTAAGRQIQTLSRQSRQATTGQKGTVDQLSRDG